MKRLFLCAVLMLVGCSSTSGSSGMPYLKRACVNFRAMEQGAHDHTMTTGDEIVELDKMIVNTQTAENVNSDWHTFNLSAKQLRVAVLQNDAVHIQTNVAFFSTTCDGIQSN